MQSSTVKVILNAKITNGANVCNFCIVGWQQFGNYTLLNTNLICINVSVVLHSGEYKALESSKIRPGKSSGKTLSTESNSHQIWY